MAGLSEAPLADCGIADSAGEGVLVRSNSHYEPKLSLLRKCLGT
jgi:hypothetical protein